MHTKWQVSKPLTVFPELYSVHYVIRLVTMQFVTMSLVTMPLVTVSLSGLFCVGTRWYGVPRNENDESIVCMSVL